jgi:hypothetical protein
MKGREFAVERILTDFDAGRLSRREALTALGAIRIAVGSCLGSQGALLPIPNR